MHFIGPFGVLDNLLLGRSPLFEVDEVETLRQQAIHIARHGTMILHDARRYPLGNAPTLKQIIIDWPHHGAVRVGSPPRMPRGGEERVLDGKDQATTWYQQSTYRHAHGPKICDVVQRQCTVDEIKGRVWQRARANMFSDRSTPSTLAAPISRAHRANAPNPQPKSSTHAPSSAGSMRRNAGHSGAPARPSRERRNWLYPAKKAGSS